MNNMVKIDFRLKCAGKYVPTHRILHQGVTPWISVITVIIVTSYFHLWWNFDSRWFQKETYKSVENNKVEPVLGGIKLGQTYLVISMS